MAYEIPVTQARAEFAELVNRVAFGGERVVVTRHGKPIVALIPAADLERLDEAQQQPARIVRLSTDAPGAPLQAPAPAHRRLDIAAKHQTPGSGNPGSTPR